MSVTPEQQSTRRRVSAALLVVVVGLVPALLATAPAGAAGRVSTAPHGTAGGDWTTFDQNGLRTGVDPSGTSFSPATTGWTSPAFDGQIYAQPLIATGRVFTATENDTVYALAADTGAVLWSTHVGTPLTDTTVPGLCTDIGPVTGITSTPVIDLARGELFVVAAEQAAGNDTHHLIGLNLYTGTVILDEAIDPASVVSPAFELQRVSLALTDGRVQIGFGGNAGDCGWYHGIVVSAPEDGSAPTSYIVADLPGDRQGAVWMGGGAPPVDAQGDVWVATGNSEDPSATNDGSDSVLRLSPTSQLVGSFTPTTWQDDNANDKDLGSMAPTLLPNGLVFQVGKLHTAYVLSQSHLGGLGGQLQEAAGFCGTNPGGASADLDGTLFVPCADGIRAVTPTASSPPTALWKTTSAARDSPIVAGGLVWSIGAGTLFALDPATGDAVQQFTTGATANSFPSPAAADGILVTPCSCDNGDSNHLLALVGPAGLPGPPDPIPGYWLVASDGGVFSYGTAAFHGSAGGLRLNSPIVGMAATPDRQGYWLVAADGGVFAYGAAAFHGSMGGKHLNQPIVGMAATADGGGYWLVAADGGIFAYGDAAFVGSTGDEHLNSPVVGMTSDPDDHGYRLVAADGGIFAFGTAPFEGSSGGDHLSAPVAGMAATDDDQGYWLVTTDATVIPYGTALFHGPRSPGGATTPVVGIAATADGNGYWLVGAGGTVSGYGTAPLPRRSDIRFAAPVVGIAAGPTVGGPVG